MALDISKMNSIEAADKGAQLDLVHPATGEDLGAYLVLAGADSDLYRKAKNKQAEAMRRRKGKALTLEEVENNALDMLATLTLGWGGIEDGGREMEFRRDAARSLYASEPWIREQAEAFVYDRANYLRD